MDDIVYREQNSAKLNIQGKRRKAQKQANKTKKNWIWPKAVYYSVWIPRDQIHLPDHQAKEKYVLFNGVWKVFTFHLIVW